jgi:hypothetical protein
MMLKKRWTNRLAFLIGSLVASNAFIAAAVPAGIEADQEDIFPDPMSNQVYATWKQDYKAIEKPFAAM